MMRLGERVDLIKNLSQTMSSSTMDWNDIDLVLRQAGLRTRGLMPDEDQNLYCTHLLEGADEETLQELDDYLHSATDSTVGDEPRTTGPFRLFISHIHPHRALATELKQELARFGIEGFVAHDDIEPAKEWQRVIEASLRSCDALVALLHDGFRESKWCDQEVGFVLGRSQPVIPIECDLHPYGFFGSIQSLPAARYTTDELAVEVCRALLRDPRCGDTLTESLVDALAHSGGFSQSNAVAALLASDAPVFTVEQLTRLRRAQLTNGQVTDAWAVGSSLRRLEQRFDITTPPVSLASISVDDDNPF